MTTLRPLAWGLLVVLVDIRLGAFDVLPDAVGWLIALFALRAVRHRHAAFGVAALGCLVAGVAAVLAWAGPYGALGVVDTICTEVVVFATCTGIIATVPERAWSAERIRWSSVGLALMLVLVLPIAAGTYLGPVAILLALAAVAVYVWFLSLVVSVSRRAAPVVAQVGDDAQPVG